MLEAVREPLTMAFGDIERLLGFRLPASARRHDAWWLDRSANTTHSHAKAWLDVRRRVVRVDRGAEIVTFSALATTLHSPNIR
ncbi:MAG: hypothetical protein M0004_01495 [Actinomycetota bacterium]|nr:hypothetical protein [Actinomycetota bacterium]